MKKAGYFTRSGAVKASQFPSINNKTKIYDDYWGGKVIIGILYKSSVR
jgi:hypothetical protein